MNTRMSAKTKSPEMQDLPVWCQPEAPLGSAVRYVASLSPAINWVGVSRWKGKVLKPGPSIGTRARKSKLDFPILDPAGKRVGRLEVESGLPEAFGAEQEMMIKKVAAELGAVWPE